ncbi:MAG TPA: hypothetical protein VEG64_15970 [Candidatus Sulfotelmatobacter sp.]|nr:hypothetical protein [Candidatus Sulfotelmatobacter sp.]
MEGERSPQGQAHVRECARCRGLLDDLSLIVAAARDSASAQMEPPPGLWNSLRAQLEQEGLIHEPGRATAGWFPRMFGVLPRPVFAGAYLAALIAVAFALSGPINQRINKARWLRGSESAMLPVTSHIKSVEQGTNASALSPVPDLNPVATASLHENLAIVDKYIALCEKSVQEEPENEFARDYLVDAYQQKAELLAQLSERGGNGR